MTPTKEQVATIADELARRLIDQGRLIESGWVILRGMALPPDTPEVQVNEMRIAFMSGAQHLFSSIMGVLEPGDEPTAADLRRLDLIGEELNRFRQEMELRFNRPQGRA